MKKIIYLLYFLLSIFMFYMKVGLNNISFIISLGLGLIFYGIFSKVSIKEELEKYSRKGIKNKYLIYSIIYLFIIFLLLGGISYIIALIIKIKYLNIINIVMTFMMFSLVLFKVISEYLDMHYHKLSKVLNSLFHISNILLSVISIILFKYIFKIDNYINIIVLYGIPIFNIIIISLLFCFFIIRKDKSSCKGKINIKEIKNNLIKDKNGNFYNVIKASYIYVSIIILYYVLNNRYNYDIDIVASYITGLYFYGIIFIYYIYIIIKRLFKEKYTIIEGKIINKEKDIDKSFHNLINNIIKYGIGFSILLMIISGPLTNILYPGKYNFIFDLVILLFFYILYDIIMSINILCNERRFKLVILSGFVANIIFEVPLIDSFYRMGYTLSFGGILSIVLGYTISIIMGLIFIHSKLKINYLNNFNNILDIVYKNIILCVILVLFTFILDVKSTNIWYSFINVIVYSLITIIYYIFINVKFLGGRNE